MRKKNKKTTICFIIIGAVLLGFTVYYCYPTFVNIFYQAEREIEAYGDSLSKISDTTQTSNGDKSVPMDTVTPNNNSIEYVNYADEYWANIEESKIQDYAYTIELLNNIETVIANSEDNDTLSCTLTLDSTNVCYTVEQINIANNLEELGISTASINFDGNNGYCNENGELNGNYQFAAVNIKMTNVGKAPAFDFPVRGFSYQMIDKTHAIYSCEFIYGTLQPGQGTHSYFATELQINETLETTALFIVPKDQQFDEYEKYIYFDPYGYGDYSPENVSLISVSKLLE